MNTPTGVCRWQARDLKVVHTDEVFDLPRVQSLAAIMNGEK